MTRKNILLLLFLFASFLSQSQVCTFLFTPSSDLYVPYSGGNRQMTLQNSCAGYYNSSVTWVNNITVVSGSSGNVFTYNVDPNPNSTQRNGTIHFYTTSGYSADFYIAQDANPYVNNCVTFYNGSTGDQDFITAANDLCYMGIIPSYIDVSTIYNNISLEDLALINYNALFPSGVAYSDNFQYPFVDIDNIGPTYKNAVLAMLYLEYPDVSEPDGVSPITRDYFNISPTSQIQNGKALKMFLEAFNIKPDNSGFNPYGTYASTFYADLSVNAPYYGYFKKAHDMGLYSNISCASGSCCPSGFMSIRDAYIMLDRILNLPSHTPINNSSFFEPNTFTTTSLGAKADIDRGVFLHYEDPSFSIDGGGIPLEFIHSYHSNWTEIPRYITESYDTLIYIQRFNPLGVGWTHNYNIYMERVNNILTGEEKYMFWWADGTVDIYDYTHSQWLTTPGRYYDINIYGSGGVTYFNVTNKDKTTYKFASGGYYGICDLVEIRDKNNNTLSLSYENGNSFGLPAIPQRLRSVTDNVSGRSLTIFYQPYSNLIQSVSDNTNRNIYFNIDANRDLRGFTDAMGGTYSYNYGTNAYDQHLLVSVTKPKGNTINNSYVERKLKQTQSNAYVIDVDFHNPYSGNAYTYSTIDVTKNGQQLTTTVQNDFNGMPINVTSSTTNITYTYGNSYHPSLPTQIRDNNKNITTNLSYDSRGNPLTIQKTSGGLTQSESFVYDNYFNEVRSHTNARGYTTNYTLDVNGNVVRIDYPNSTNIQFGRNVNGNVTSVQHQDGKVTQLNYNSYGNLESYGIYGTGINYNAGYDAVSHLTSVVDPKGYSTSYNYNANDNITQETSDPGGLNELTSYTYDLNENLTNIRDAEYHYTNLSYDYNTDDLVSENYGSYSKYWTYNQDGTVSSFTNKNGQPFSYQYFPKYDPREGFLMNDGYTLYDYDTYTRNLNSASRNGKSISFQYDALGRVSTVGSTDFSGNQVNYQYDQNNNIIQINYPFGFSAHYIYDALDRLKSVSDANNVQLVHYSYYPDGKLQREDHGNGTYALYFYDSANRLDSIANLTSNGSVISAYGYSMDANGNHTEERINEPNQTGPFQSIPVDQNYASTYSYDNMNRLTSTNFNAWSHNPNGDHTSHGNYTYTYDEKDNLLTAYNGNTNVLDNYEYDAFENRRLKDNTRYAIDILNNSNVLLEVNASTGSAIAVYYHGLGLTCRYDITTATYSYYHYDSRGSTTAITDASQNVTHTYRYGTFGDVASQSEAFAQPFKYVGKYGVQFDADNLYFMRNRYYNPYYGRFYGEDPIWSTNLFPYAGNNPINKIDPSGKYIETAIDLASLGYDAYEFKKDPSLLNGVFLALDVVTTALPFVAAGGTIARELFLGGKIAKDELAYTKSSLKLGQEMHSAYHLGEVGKEFRLPSGKRIDFLHIDGENGFIYELKPNNPRAIKAGKRQLETYLKELESMPRFRGINFKTILETY